MGRRVLFTEGELRATIRVTSERRKRPAAAPFACYSARGRGDRALRRPEGRVETIREERDE